MDGAARPLLEPGGVALAAKDVVGLDPPVLGRRASSRPSSRPCPGARRVGEQAVAGQNQNAVSVVELLADRRELVDPAEALSGVDQDQVDLNNARPDVTEHLLVAGPLLQVPSGDPVVTVVADVDPGMAQPFHDRVDRVELLLGTTGILLRSLMRP